MKYWKTRKGMLYKMNTCDNCGKTFSSKSNLNAHKKTSKSCGITVVYKCKHCEKELTTESGLQKHDKICISKKLKIEFQQLLEEKEQEYRQLLLEKEKESRQLLLEKEKEFQCLSYEKDLNYKQLLEEKNLLIVELKIARENLDKLTSKVVSSKIEDHRAVDDDIKNIIDDAVVQHFDKLLVLENGNLDTLLTKDYKLKIKMLEDKYVKKQPRMHYEEKNVVYILTTPDHIKKRKYICGKAKNLTNRLSTYNKTEEHEVIYYRECGSEKQMDLVEQIFLNKLDVYRERANRDRFILPDGENISLFKEILDKCIKIFIDDQ